MWIPLQAQYATGIDKPSRPVSVLLARNYWRGCLFVKCKGTACVCAVQEAVVREVTLMRRFNHPALLPLHACFVHGRELWVVTPYMGQGSIRSIMLRQFPEVGCSCLLR